MQADWPLIRDMFTTDSVLGFTFTKTMFNGAIRVIKETDNELFHSNPIKDRKKIVDSCERILNGLQFYLGDYDHGVAQYVRVPATVARAQRYVIRAR